MIDGSLNGSGSSNIPTSPSESNSNTNYAKNNPNIGGSGIHGVGRDVVIDDVRIYKSYLSDSDWSTAMSGSY